MEKPINAQSPEILSLTKKAAKPLIRKTVSKSVSYQKINNKDSFQSSKKKVLNNSKIFKALSPLNSKSFNIRLPALEKSVFKINLKKADIKRNLNKILDKSTSINNTSNSIEIKPQKGYEFHYVTRTGSIDGKTKPYNQDSRIVLPNFSMKNQCGLFCVLDGHGPNGHLVSNYLEKKYPELLSKYICGISPNIAEETVTNTFKQVIRELCNSLKNASIDILHSGTTFLSLLLYENECICTSVGDSRGIIAEMDRNWTVKVLNKEHKPNDPAERKRIEECGGRVGCMKGSNGKPMGPIRAWGSSQNSPGLAMSRTIGDTFAQVFGVISEPDVKIFPLCKNDKFIVIATDGLWDSLTNAQVIEIVKWFWENNDVEGAADALLQNAVKVSENNGGYVDDITIIVIFR